MSCHPDPATCNNAPQLPSVEGMKQHRLGLLAKPLLAALYGGCPGQNGVTVTV